MSKAPTLSTEPEYAKVSQVNAEPTVEINDIDRVYRIPEIAEYIIEKGYKKPCLQFPDSLVQDSALVAGSLQKKIGMPAFILADTAYSPCCIDEIAAQHVHGDVVFHFGSACLNPTKSLPAVYVRRLENTELIDNHSQHLRSIATNSEGEPSGPILIYPDTQYLDIAMKLANKHRNAVVAVPFSETADFIPNPSRSENEKHSIVEIPNRVLSKALDVPLSECSLLYITDTPSESLMLHWSTVFNSMKVISGLGAEHNVRPLLRKRYLYVQNIKAAGTIGVLVNTLSLRDTAKLLDRTKKAVTAADKKFYMFVVGKPNVAKLGNFEVVDVWVVLGCPQGGVIVDQEEYMKPIVTPYELELAFNDDWTGKWILDFGQVLTEYGEDDDGTSGPTKNGDDDSHNSKSAEDDEEEPLFDLVTGKFVFGNTPLRQVEHLDLNGQELQTSSNSLTIRNTISTAAQKLQQRSWTGLGSDHADIKGESAELKKGRSGIARNYNED